MLPFGNFWLIWLCGLDLFRSSKQQKLNRIQSRYDYRTGNYRAWREQFIIRKLLKEYQPNVRPHGMNTNTSTEDGGPVVITTSVQLRSISTVSDANMEFVAQFRFQQEWYDQRLAFSDLYIRNFDFINVAEDQKIWRPDTFFQNERDGWYHNLDQPNVFMKINSKGKIIYNRRLTLTLACNMNLLRYPMDTQTCVIDFASYAYTTKDIVYEWDHEPLRLHAEAGKILPNFFIKDFTNSTCTSITSTGTYSCLRVNLGLERVFSYFLLQLYIPSSMLVAVSWVSYWIDWKSTAARVPLAIVTLLTMITQSASTNANLPPVSYTKALDVWIGACVMFIFASLIEYAIVNYIGLSDEREKQSKLDQREKRFGALNLEEIVEGERRKKGMADRKRSKRLRKPTMDDFPEIFGSPSTSSNADSPEERITLLRKRGRLGRRERYTEEFELKEINANQSPSQFGQSSRHMSEPDWVIEELDLIKLTNSKKMELFRVCDILQSKTRAERIDMIARIIFPSSFFMFNIAYWVVYWGENS